jgi:hypothetical protein
MARQGLLALFFFFYFIVCVCLCMSCVSGILANVCGYSYVC